MEKFKKFGSILCSFTLYTGMGLILGMLFKQTKKLVVCILLHAANNLLGLIAYLI